ncbi:MAG TPA: hypothetical protein VHB70_01290 [Parafilimonas sp.]|nr:hypothetical protein [Parafilimonas sp.]
MKIFIGALVGAIIIFLLQFLSWGVLNLHRAAQQYTPKQDEILSYLNTQFDSSGGYLMPTTPLGTSSKEMEEQQAQSKGKPWAQVYYHTSYDASMPVNMVKNFINNFLMVLFFCWIISGYTANSFGKTFIAAILVGLIIFMHSSYTEYIWYKTFDLYAHLTDYLLTWGFTGLWLGWWLNRRNA